MSLRQLILEDVNRLRDVAGLAKTSSVFRGCLNPRVQPVALFRLAHRLNGGPFRILGTVLTWLNVFVYRVEIPARAKIGPGLVLPHPQGIVVGSAEIGRNVTLFQNVTLGARSFDGAYDLSTRPILEDGCLIGAGAVVLGPVRIGKNASVAANSLVLHDVPEGRTVMGVPAQPKSP